MGRRILVTGGAGFLGSHLCERLLAAGNFVYCLDDFSSGKKDNIASLKDNPHFDLMEQCVTEPVSLAVDWIFNLASPASPADYQGSQRKHSR